MFQFSSSPRKFNTQTSNSLFELLNYYVFLVFLDYPDLGVEEWFGLDVQIPDFMIWDNWRISFCVANFKSIYPSSWEGSWRRSLWRSMLSRRRMWRWRWVSCKRGGGKLVFLGEASIEPGLLKWCSKCRYLSRISTRSWTYEHWSNK